MYAALRRLPLSRQQSIFKVKMLYTKGQEHHFDGRHLPGLTRCKMYHYLRRLLGCQSAAVSCLR